MESVILARHGESVFSARQLVNGDTATAGPLTERGAVVPDQRAHVTGQRVGQIRLEPDHGAALRECGFHVATL
jgi:broad specificity phosphatase PhoE